MLVPRPTGAVLSPRSRPSSAARTSLRQLPRLARLADHSKPAASARHDLVATWATASRIAGLLRARRFASGAVRGIERHVRPDRLGDRPTPQDIRELVRILDVPVLGAKLENGPGLFGPDARELEQLRRIREIDPHPVWHGRLLAN